MVHLNRLVLPNWVCLLFSSLWESCVAFAAKSELPCVFYSCWSAAQLLLFRHVCLLSLLLKFQVCQVLQGNKTIYHLEYWHTFLKWMQFSFRLLITFIKTGTTCSHKNIHTLTIYNYLNLELKFHVGVFLLCSTIGGVCCGAQACAVS